MIGGYAGRGGRVLVRPLAVLVVAGCHPDYRIDPHHDIPDIPDDTAPDVVIPDDTDPTPPIAVCAVDPGVVAPPFGVATFDGSGSDDPQGHSLSYDWKLVSSPRGSAVELPASGGSRRDLVPDVAGAYTARLVVTSDDGRVSDACEATVDAIPTDDLWVELYWAHGGDDMDLHLLAPGGTLRDPETDCFFATCRRESLHWPDAADANPADDPSLDLDDIPGTGPENVNILTPYAGTYTIVVADHPSAVYEPANPVTVTVYVGGAAVWTDTRDVVGEGVDTVFATIDWPGGAVTAR
jgi:hypothetical protein